MEIILVPPWYINNKPIPFINLTA